VATAAAQVAVFRDDHPADLGRRHPLGRRCGTPV